MKKPFSWERGPFEQCPNCRQQEFGFLSAGGDGVTLRCKTCRYSHCEILPAVDKKTIYLDQFMFSCIFKIKAGGRAPFGQQDFYDELIPLLQRVVLLQQAIFPHSDIHFKETTVFYDPQGLRAAFEEIGGAVSFRDSHEIEMNQVFAFANAFRDGGEPILKLTQDEIVRGSRNDWLPDLRISLNTDYSNFAKGIRRARDKGFKELQGMMAVWRAEKPTFPELLHRESQFGKHRRIALADCIKRTANATDAGNIGDLVNGTSEPIWREFTMLREIFGVGSTIEDTIERVIEFWEWPRMTEMPTNQIFSYLFASLGRRVAYGQQKVTPGILTDFNAIATYAPYVDAMFLDKECAHLLAEPELQRDLHYRARIFSYSNKDAFLAYLRNIVAQATDEVRYFSERIYGIK